LARHKSPILTEAELRLMDVLWSKGASTVQQVLDALPEHPALAYNTVLTTIRILEKKGYVRHSKDGRAHVYRAKVRREDATRSEIQRLVSRFFENSHQLLVLNLLESRDIDAEEMKRLRQVLDLSEANDLAEANQDQVEQDLSEEDQIEKDLAKNDRGEDRP